MAGLLLETIMAQGTRSRREDAPSETELNAILDFMKMMAEERKQEREAEQRRHEAEAQRMQVLLSTMFCEQQKARDDEQRARQEYEMRNRKLRTRTTRERETRMVYRLSP